MQDLLIENIKKTINYQLNDEELLLLTENMQHKSFDRKAILSNSNTYCKEVFFILKGSAYSYTINELGEKIAIQFALEGYWITDHYSFFSSKPGFFTIETLEVTEVLSIKKENFEKVCSLSHPIEHFFRVLIQNAFASLQYRLAKTNTEDAVNRYLEFSNIYPGFVQRIPQYLIATYLGIKPQSLSRIRKNLIKK